MCCPTVVVVVEGSPNGFLPRSSGILVTGWNEHVSVAEKYTPISLGLVKSAPVQGL